MRVVPAAVVFDLDGTLIDSVPDVRAAINRLLVGLGRRALGKDEAESMIGEGATALVTMAFAATGSPIDADDLPVMIGRYVEAYRGAPVDNTLVYPGVREVLPVLRERGFKLGICTNKPAILTQVVLDALGMSRLFDGFAAGDSLPYRKPDGRHIQATLERMGAADLPAVMVGDSNTDADAARSAGVPMIAVRYGYSKGRPEDIDADILIDTFASLPDALDRIFAR